MLRVRVLTLTGLPSPSWSIHTIDESHSNRRAVSGASREQPSAWHTPSESSAASTFASTYTVTM